MVDQLKMPDSTRNHLKNNMIGQDICGLIIKKVLGSGNTAVTYEVEDTHGIPWALKVVWLESYGDRAPFREIGRFAQAKDERFLAFPKDIGEWTLEFRNKKYKFIWLKSRYVRGLSLRNFLQSNIRFSVKEEITRYMEDITVALEELQRLGFSHGDLHDRNIMREVVGEEGALPDIQYVVIDFSNAHPIEDTREGILKDIEYFGRHLRSFYDTAYQREHIGREDEKALVAVSHIPGLLNGVAPESMGISKASDILDRFKDSLRSSEEPKRKLSDPFHPLCAENIASDALLADLCFTRIWWIKELERNENVLLVGPRGCGKTMIFKRLRFRTKIAAKKLNEIKDDSYMGFYIPCESLFYMRFSDLSEVDIETYRDALILYFNMTILAELASTLSALPDYLGPVSRRTVVSLANLLRNEIGALWEELAYSDWVINLHELARYAEDVMRYIRKSIAYGSMIPSRGSIDFVMRLVDMVKQEVPAISQKTFIFFLDDYTAERVPLRLQEALHPVVCQRSADICFKISAHMFGSIYSVPRPLALDEGRNIKVINLGTAYLVRNRRKLEGKTLLQILNQRFKYSEGYKGTIEDWLGNTSYPGGRTLSWALRDVNTRPKVRYHGTKCLMDLCSGDYSEMIRMVGEIFREAGIDSHSHVRKIDPSIQSRAIERLSREYLARVRHIRPDGQKLFDIVNNFGELSKRLLYEHKLVGQGLDSKGHPRKDPYDLLNIYIDDLTRINKTAQDVWQRLQHASIFVDIGIATSQRLIIADRATLRRIYCPAFKTTLTSSEHLQATKMQFEWFMDKPDEFCREYLRRVTSRPTEQLDFWGEETTETEPTEVPSTFMDLPEAKDYVDLLNKAPSPWINAVDNLPELVPVDDLIEKASNFDLYIAAMGYEERTIGAATALVNKDVRVNHAVILEFDRYYKETEKRREKYERIILKLTQGKPYRPLNAPVGAPDPFFPERLMSLLKSLTTSKIPNILLDVTSCPSLILSQALTTLLNYHCRLTLLYSEAEIYFPTRNEWETGKVQPYGGRVQGPFAGVRFVAKPPLLQADDIGELPVLLILFPTFNMERTEGVLADLEPATRIWIFGEPHDLSKNDYRIDMERKFAGPIMHPGDPWTLITTFDYRKTLLALARIYAENRFNYRIVVMPHGSKMQTLGVNLFATVHDLSQAFAMARTYDPNRYSRGCLKVWAIPIGKTEDFIVRLRSWRAIDNGKMPTIPPYR